MKCITAKKEFLDHYWMKLEIKNIICKLCRNQCKLETHDRAHAIVKANTSLYWERWQCNEFSLLPIFKELEEAINKDKIKVLGKNAMKKIKQKFVF